jgi:exosortase H (IPTLxxWG-CTERM-specific)
VSDADENDSGAASSGAVSAGNGASVEIAEPEGRGPWLRFAVTFGCLAIASETLYYGVILESDLFDAYLTLLAKIGGAILALFDSGIAVHVKRISSSKFAVEIAQGCDAIQVCSLLAAAVIAFPVQFKYKLRGLVWGIATLQFLNLMRIVTLFWIGAYFGSVFQVSHEVVWPGILIVLTIVIWVAWVRWEDRSSHPRPNAT